MVVVCGRPVKSSVREGHQLFLPKLLLAMLAKPSSSHNAFTLNTALLRARARSSASAARLASFHTRSWRRRTEHLPIAQGAAAQ